jgi:hypothetical protein
MAEPDFRKTAQEALETTPFAQRVAFLNEALTPRLVAFCCGINETKSVRGWAEGAPFAYQSLKDQLEPRIDCTFYIVKLLSNFDSFKTIRAWFMGMNPELNDDSPASTIAWGRFHDAKEAATAYITNG